MARLTSNNELTLPDVFAMNHARVMQHFKYTSCENDCVVCEYCPKPVLVKREFVLKQLNAYASCVVII
jgi:hypothetical protein